jgi:hypothetical protein
MEVLNWLWFTGGVGVTALVILALAYWIVQEMQARRSLSPPPPFRDETHQNSSRPPAPDAPEE